MDNEPNKMEMDKEDPLARILAGIAADEHVFVVRGAAGTGKTTLIGRLIPELESLRYSVALLAPTGRAAKMAQIRSGHPAATIHSTIYKIDDRPVAGTAEDGDLKWIFGIKPDLPVRTAFVIDEASMVGVALHNEGILQFGTGSLLQDLLDYVAVERPDSENIVIFVGDPYQLPPVKEKAGDPPALDDRHLGGLTGRRVISVDLTEVHRQSHDSGILAEANRLRTAIAFRYFGSFSYQPHPDVHVVAEGDLPRLYRPTENLNEKIIISYTNARVWEFNSLVRRSLGYLSDLPRAGERLLSLRNTQVAVSGEREARFMNGDMMQILAIDDSRLVTLDGFYRPKGKAPLHYRFTFCRMTLGWLYEDGQEDADVWVNVTPIVSEAYRETPEYAHVALYVAVINHIRERLKKKFGSASDDLVKMELRKSRLYHAPWVTFGYAITGHKSQGGEWREAWIDFQYPQNRMTEDFFRWMYTVTTRARKDLFVLAPPAFDDIDEALGRALARMPVSASVSPRREPPMSLGGMLGRHGYSIAEKVQHPYSLHIRLGRTDDPFADSGTLDVTYNGKGVVSYVRLACVGADDALGREVAALRGRKLAGLFPEESECPASAMPTIVVNECQSRVCERLQAAAKKAGISLVSIRSLTPHQLRMELSSDLGEGYVDFYIDGKGRVSEMGSMTIGADNLRLLKEGLQG